MAVTRRGFIKGIGAGIGAIAAARFLPRTRSQQPAGHLIVGSAPDWEPRAFPEGTLYYDTPAGILYRSTGGVPIWVDIAYLQ